METLNFTRLFIVLSRSFSTLKAVCRETFFFYFFPKNNILVSSGVRI